MRLFGISIKSLLPWQLASRIRMLTFVLDKFGRGDFSQKAPISQDDLIGKLGIKMNEIADSLSSKIDTLNLERLQLETIIGSMSEGMAVTNGSGIITTANPAWYWIFGSSPKSLGRPILESVRIPQIFGIISEVIGSKKPCEVEFGVGERFFMARAVPFETESELACVTVVNDVTKLKQMETMRRDFTANVSHQMKTPLTSILGYSETLLSGKVKDPVSTQSFAKVIHEQGEKLKELIDDILELAKIESQSYKAELTRVDIRVLLKSIIKEFEHNNKGVTITGELPDIEITTDLKAIRHILHNLIDNAVKYSPSGGTVRITGETNGKIISISVADNGIGIPEPELGRIFERFYRASAPGNVPQEGSGLGLAIAKHLAEKLNGTISVNSSTGAGSTFTIFLPAS